MPERRKTAKIYFAVNCKKDVFFLDKEIDPPKIEASNKQALFKNQMEDPEFRRITLDSIKGKND